MAMAGGVAAKCLSRANASEERPEMPFLGPIIGHSDSELTIIWMRSTKKGTLTLEVIPEVTTDDQVRTKIEGTALPENDFCVQWRITSLKPGQRYGYRILQQFEVIADHEGQVFTVPLPSDVVRRVCLAISSCAREDEGSRMVWQRMAAESVDGVVLIGDTPYIDSTELTEQTRRHQEFAAVAEYQQLLSSRPCWWTWDDHDFAGNDSSGLADGKENSRLVYTRYRPQKQYGDGIGGIYTSFRQGPIEVFLLDTRWYSMTGPSFAATHKPTMLGAAQWKWLSEGLLKSTAPFKLLACGVIWDDKENSESDDWGTYRHELTAIQKFIGTHKISGVILVGGDIHASRVLRYPTEKTVGYNMVQMIASPVHSSTIPSLNVYNPDLVRSAVEPNVFLRLDADSTVQPPVLEAVLINARGEHVFSYRLTADELKAK